MIVVGAGIAGLAVANALGHAGVDCSVLEARNRIGGRLHTIDVAGTPVDLGGSWIHHPVGNPLSALAAVTGVATHPGDPTPTLSAFDCADGRPLTSNELAAVLDLQFTRFPDELDALRVETSPDATSAEAVDAFLASIDLLPPQARRARQALRAIIEADAADRSERQSLRWLWNEIEYGGDLFGDLPTHGLGSVVDALAGGVDIRRGAEVERVEIAGDGVRVVAVDGAAFEGSHAVVAVPLGVLKEGRPFFSPELPTERREAIQRLGFGAYEKIVLAFAEPFWRDLGLSHFIAFPGDAERAAIWVFDLDAFGAGPALSFHLFASNADRALASTDDAAAAWAVQLLSQVTGAPCPTPAGVAVTRWTDDRLARGAYSHVTPQASPADLDLLGAPVGGRVLFAGEHTQSARTGYADGALSSGVREAMRLLGRDRVELGRLRPGGLG